MVNVPTIEEFNDLTAQVTLLQSKVDALAANAMPQNVKDAMKIILDYVLAQTTPPT